MANGERADDDAARRRRARRRRVVARVVVASSRARACMTIDLLATTVSYTMTHELYI